MENSEIDERMRRHAPGAFHLPSGRATFMELTDRGDGRVWMSAAPVTRQEYDAFRAAEPWVKTGIGAASMDAAAFRCSPSREGGVSVTRTKLADFEFLCVARPLGMEPPFAAGGPIRATVDKYHTLGFRAGRDVRVLHVGGDHFVEVVGDHLRDSELTCPPGARLSVLRLERSWVVDLPTPTVAWFWLTPVLRSFQGPVTLPAGYA